MLDRDSPFRPAPDRRRPEPMAVVAWRGLRDALVACDLAPGTVITEGALAARFGFGLAATRSGLARLSALGWIAAEPRRGWRVLAVSGAHLADLCRARALLEPALEPAVLAPEARAGIATLAEVHHAALVTGRDAAAVTRQALRLHLALLPAVPAGRVRDWLGDTWRLAARADAYFCGWLGQPAPRTDLRPLAAATVAGDAAGMHRALAEARAAFAARCLAATARSDAPLAPASTKTGPARPDKPGIPPGDRPAAGADHHQERQDDPQP